MIQTWLLAAKRAVLIVADALRGWKARWRETE
jgi:hypothetical protein